MHKAVIANDIRAVTALHGKYLECCDDLGFTPIEIAQLLGRQQCCTLLNPQAFNLSNTKTLQPQIEQQFQITYSPFLFFNSYESLREVIHQCPYILRSSWLANDNYAYYRQYRTQIESAAIA